MDWSKLLKFRVSNKPLFTIYVLLIYTATLLLLWLVNRFLLPNETPDVTHINKDFIAELFTNQQDKMLFAPETVLVALFVLLLVWILVVFLPILWNLIQEITDVFSAYEKSRKFFLDDCLNNLTFQGRVEKISKRGFRITSSDSGALIKYYYWKNFSIDFVFNFEKFKTSVEFGYTRKRRESNVAEKIEYLTNNNWFGFVFRALDLNNYFMIAIGIKDLNGSNAVSGQKKQLWIVPHVRVDGNWDILTHEIYPMNAETAFNEKKPHEVNILVNKNKLELSFKEIGEKPFVWNLPSNYRANWPVKEKEIIGEKYGFGDESIIRFRDTYGMIGFRCYGDENVIISNIEVTQL